MYYDGSGIYSPTTKVVDYAGGTNLLFKKLVECFPQELQSRYEQLRKNVLSNENIISNFNQFMKKR